VFKSEWKGWVVLLAGVPLAALVATALAILLYQ
jgi:hypothetical protein